MNPIEQLMQAETTQGRERRVYGVVTARVTGVMEDGTYEVAYLSMGSNEPSAPARVMMPMAGDRRGTYFFPEAGDEVVVAFENGDTNFPVILGAVWNNQAPPPEQAEASPENHVRTIVSRSGHELTFDDRPSGEKVKIKTKGGHELLLDDTPPGKVTLKSRGGIAIEMDDLTGTLTLRAPLAIAFQSPTASMTISAGMQVNSPAGVILTTTGSATASAVVIDGKPFGLHMHLPPVVPTVPPTTGPVAP